MPGQPMMSRRTKLLIGGVFGVMVGVAAVAPISLMLVPDPLPVRVGDLASQPSGAYITTRGVTYHVFPRADRLDAFPPDAPTVDSTPVLTIKARQVDAPSDYALYTFDGAGVNVTRTTVPPGVVEMRPTRPLRAGRYIATIARDDLFGGTDYVYFSVAATPATTRR